MILTPRIACVEIFTLVPQVFPRFSWTRKRPKL